MPEKENKWNSPTSREWESELLIEYVENLKRPGVMEARRERSLRFDKILDRMSRERVTLTEKHPGKWVVMGEDGIVALGDSLGQVVDEAHRRGLRGSDLAIEFLDPDPPIYIL